MIKIRIIIYIITILTKILLIFNDIYDIDFIWILDDILRGHIMHLSTGDVGGVSGNEGDETEDLSASDGGDELTSAKGPFHNETSEDESSDDSSVYSSENEEESLIENPANSVSDGYEADDERICENVSTNIDSDSSDSDSD